MNDAAIIAEFDKSVIVGLQLVIALFTAVFIVLSLVFAITLTAFTVGCWVLRKTLVFLLSHKQNFTFAKLATGLSV